MKKLFLSILLLLFAIPANAVIDEKVTCEITYYNNVTFENMTVGEMDNFPHVLNAIFYLDNQNKKLYNSERKIIQTAIFNNNIISVDWGSTKNPRFCFLFDKNKRNVKFKAYFTLPPKPIGNTGKFMPPSTTKANGHGTCTFTKL